ncbi:nucleoporin Nup186/Nup192/Nup205 [Pilobolus umbonatus]|nr:nucleoporin Nup186/Nup192/Nup205 [Pilobolus umbonatus]
MTAIRSEEELCNLFNIVCQASDTSSPSAALQLEIALGKSRDIFLQLLDNPSKNEAHRKEVQSGKTIINGTTFRINEEFINETIYLSNELDIDEYEASRLLLEGTKKARLVNSTPLDTAVTIYHTERSYILTTMCVILENAKDRTVNDQIQSISYHYMADIITNKIDNSPTFIKKILTTSTKLNNMIKSLSKKGTLNTTNPGNNSTTPAINTTTSGNNLNTPANNLPSSNNNQPQPTTKFSEDVLTLRIDKLKEERIYLIQLLYHLSSSFWLLEEDILDIIDLNQTVNLADSISPYLVTTLLAIISPNSIHKTEHQPGVSFIHKETLLSNIHKRITDKEWSVPTMKATVLLQWVTFIKALSNHQHKNILSLDEEARMELVMSSIRLDAFQFMNTYLLYFKQKRHTKKHVVKKYNPGDSDMVIDGFTVDHSDYKNFNADIHYDFQKYIIHELEAWSMSFIGNMSSLLRKLKYNEEDTLVSNQSPHSSNIAYVNENPTANNDLENFLTLLASIFRERLDSGLSFWIQDGGLFSFVKWLLEVKIAGTLRASFDFLGSIATGTVCATHAYSFFSTGTNHNDIFASHLFSWGKLFAGLQFYIGLYNEHKSDNSSPMLPAAEEESLCKFIYFCQQVVQYSDEAREELWTSKLFKTPESIMGMICCPTFGSLRVALFDLLAAFCSNWGGGVNSVGFNIAHDVWRMLEKSDFIIPVKVMVRGTGMKDIAGQQTLINGTTSTKTLLSDTLPVDQKDIMHLIGQPKGFLVTYESEKKARIYPETLSFVNLIASLIHTTSKREELISGFSYSAPSIPARLGEESHRSPGTAPYISVIVDHIFLDLKNQKFAFIEDKWQLVDACLHVMENSVNSFNLEPFCEYFSRSSQPETIVTSYTSALQGQGQTVQRSSDISKELISYITHPGFDIIVRVLSDSGLTRELFEIIKRGRFGVLDDSTTKAEKNPYFKNSLARCLRIFSRILSIQNAFVNLLLPYINQTAVSYSTYEYKLEQYVFPNPPSLESLSRLFLYNSSVIIELALLVNCNEHEEIYDLSASLLNDLSSNPEEGIHKYQVAKHINQAMGGLGAQLSGVLFSSTNADLIISSFSERLGINSEEVFTYDDYEYDINTIPFWLAKNTLHNVYQLNDDRQKHYTLSIRIAILDLLLKNIRKEVKSPTVTEFLLGYDINELEKTSVQRKPLSGDEQNPRLACFYLIINLLRTGIEEADDSINNISLIKSNPVLAEKCYELIFRLCSRESTTTPTLQYLRNDETFLYSQLKYISCRLEDQLSVTEPYFEGTLISTDGGRFSTDFLTLRANLNQRAWLMKSIALELHKGIRNRQGASVSKILELLYGHAQGDGDERTHSDNGLIYQMEKLNMSYGSGYQQPLWNMLEIMNSLEFTWSDGLGEACCKFELKYFTEFSPAKFETVNYQYDGEAKAYKLFDIRNVYKYLREWEIRMLRTTGVSTEDRIQLETEMGSILKGLMAENRHREIAAARLHCLRAWKQIIQVTLTDCFDLFHFELRETITYDLLSMLLPKLEQPNRLQPDLLKGLSEVILTLLTRLREDKHRQSILKVPAGDAFPAESSLPDEKLRFVFHGILNVILKDKCDISLRSDMYTALVNFVQYISPSPVSHSKDRFPSRNIQEQIVDLITSGYESKLLTRVCNDASEGQGLFKTTAFMALESIYVLYGDRRNMSIHQHFLKNNFLQYTINMIRRCDDGLINTFEKRDGNN